MTQKANHRTRTTWLDTKHAAAYLGVSFNWLKEHTGRWCGLPGIRYGRKNWYRMDDLNKWLDDPDRIAQSGFLRIPQILRLKVSRKVRLPSQCR